MTQVVKEFWNDLRNLRLYYLILDGKVICYVTTMSITWFVTEQKTTLMSYFVKNPLNIRETGSPPSVTNLEQEIHLLRRVKGSLLTCFCRRFK